MVRHLNFTTRPGILRTRLELSGENFFDAISRVRVRIKPLVQVLALLSRGVCEDASLSLSPNLLPIAHAVHSEFGRADGTFRRKELRPAAGLNVKIELCWEFLGLSDINAILIAQPID